MAYTIQGKTSWLHAHNFSFKKPEARPAKTDPAKQEAFIHHYYETVMTCPPPWKRKSPVRHPHCHDSLTHMNLMGGTCAYGGILQNLE
ncbi:helix-turn-helix domain-containing protein [Holospora undulata]|uniref:helix-turn-helix domain-containing protein n=1 Tax=Holospora undulata TaxID=1169117 RepID=UPI001268AF3D|nr:winged helix-turn-helix domain-containing protein [Holospora undulata]